MGDDNEDQSYSDVTKRPRSSQFVSTTPSYVNTAYHHQRYIMLPPVEDTVLKSNPKFAALHATLTNTLLNPDGSTKNHPNLREHEDAREVCADNHSSLQ